MATTHSALTFIAAPSTKTKAGPGLLSRMVTALMAARLRAAEREVARYLANHGGKFTDEAEREIERRFLSNQSRW
jgi:hypothetical protein